MTAKNFEDLKEQFLIDIKVVVDMEDVPPELVFNWDQTGISIVPGSSWTIERVKTCGNSWNLRQTANYCCVLWHNCWRVSISSAYIRMKNYSLIGM